MLARWVFHGSLAVAAGLVLCGLLLVLGTIPWSWDEDERKR